MIVVKVGGSLFDHLRLGPALRAYLDALAPAEIMLVPGGGDVVEAVRKFDRVHGLGEEASHWLAVQAMDVMGEALRELCRVGRAKRGPPEAPQGMGTSKVGLEDSAHPTGLLADSGERRGVSPTCDPGHVGPRRSPVRVLNCLAFLREDESRRGALPHSWDVTSDSIAARAAVVIGAERLVLLKSVDVPSGTSWDEAAARGWVDPHLPRVVAGAAFPVEVVTFRRVLESLPA